MRLVVAAAPGSAPDMPRAPDRSMAVGAARPAIRHRQPAGAGGNIGTEMVVKAAPDG